MKEQLKVSDEQLHILVEKWGADYEKHMKLQHHQEKTKELKKILYSGLGAVRIDKMRPHDTLPATDSQGRGVRMVGAPDNNIRVYVYLPSTGDGFCLFVPFDLRVGGVPHSLRGLIAKTVDLPIEQVKLFFNFQAIVTDHATINMYNICHSSTVIVLPRTRQSEKLPDRPLLASPAGAADRTGAAMKHRAKLMGSQSKIVTVLPKWTHEHHPNLFKEDGLLGRQAGTLVAQDVVVFDYANHVAMVKDMVHVVAREPEAIRLADPTKRAEFFFAQGRKWRVNKIHRAGEISDLLSDISGWLNSGYNAGVIRPATKISDFFPALDLEEIFLAVQQRTAAVAVASVSAVVENSDRIFDVLSGNFGLEQELVHVHSVQDLQRLLQRGRTFRKSHKLKIYSSIFRLVFFAENFTASLHLVALQSPEAMRVAHRVARHEEAGDSNSALAAILGPILGGNCKPFVVLDAPSEISSVSLALIDDVAKLVSKCSADHEPLEAFSVLESVDALGEISDLVSVTVSPVRPGGSSQAEFRSPHRISDLDLEERVVELELALNDAKLENRKLQGKAEFTEIFKAYEATIDELSGEIRNLQDERSRLLLAEIPGRANRDAIVLRELRELRAAKDGWEKERRKFAVGGRCADVFMRKLHAVQQELADKTREADTYRRELELLRDRQKKYSVASEKLNSENEVLTKISGDLTQEVKILRQAMLATGGTQQSQDRILKKISLPDGRPVTASIEKSLAYLSRAKREIAATAPQAVPGILKAEKHAEIAKRDAENYRIAAEKLQAVLLRLINRTN